MPKVSEEHLEARRQQIVDAAVTCFARSGIHGTSLEDIREEADLSRGAVYHYFKSKDDIIEALRERSRGEDQEIFKNLVDPDDPGATLLRLLGEGCLRNADGAGNTDARVALFLWAEALLNERVLKTQQSLFKPWETILPGLIRDAQASGQINRDLDPDAVFFVIKALAIGSSVLMAWDEGVDLEGAKSAIYSLFAGAFGQGAPCKEFELALAKS